MQYSVICRGYDYPESKETFDQSYADRTVEDLIESESFGDVIRKWYPNLIFNEHGRYDKRAYIFFIGEKL